MRVILGSASPRRKELMGMLGIPFDVMVSDCEEVISDTHPDKVTESLAVQKAMAVANKIVAEKSSVEECFVIGSDTVVSVDNEILGKPKDKEDARKMIEKISGRTHVVYTGVAIVAVSAPGEIVLKTSFAEGTRVSVAELSQREIADYISMPECDDKAGAYAIQGMFGKYIEGIRGDYNTVVGLPVHRLYEELKRILSEKGLNALKCIHIC
ncbi:MAG: septum formation protein Maf [Eubacterium sp.]|nr:septum formation protein Maf [Eubacterium sp.]